MSIKQFLSSTTTKHELTVYLAKKAIHHFKDKPTAFIVTSWQEVLSNSVDAQHICRSQEEADARLILQDLNAARRGSTDFYIQSPDTDVFVLANRRYQKLCRNTSSLGIWNKRRVIPLGLLMDTLGAAKAEVLPGFSEADVTGRFVGKGKLTCWQVE